MESPAALHQALAWRWTSDRAEAQVARERVEADPAGSVHLTAAVVGRDALRLDWRIAVEAGAEPIRSIAVALDETDGAEADDWHFRDETTGLELARRPLDAAARDAAGLPGTGPAWELDFPSPRFGRVVVRSRREVPWTGLGRVPLLSLPARFHASGIVLIEVDRGIRTTAEATGLRTLDPASAAAAMGGDDRDEWDETRAPDRAGRRRAHAFGYDGPGGRLVLRTEDLEPARIGGVVAQAVLTTTLDPEGSSRHRLTLRVANDRPRPIVLALPDGATPVRVRRDGQAVSPVATGRSLSIPLPATTASRPFCTVTLDYQSARAGPASGAILRPECPSSSLPCLGFRWEVLAPEPWSVTARGAGLVDADPSPPSPWMRRLLASRRAWGLAPASPTEDEAAMLGALDERVAPTRPDEATLGEWFTRWDGGAWPVVIDRMALSSAGWGPKSRVVPPRVAPGRRGAANEALRPLGLAVVPIGAALLITTTAEAPDRPGGPLGEPGARAAWSAALREATAWGNDPSDRFQTVARWRGEVTPKALNPDEAAEPEPAPEGWRLRRFAAAGWPGRDATVALVDDRRRDAWAWTAGLAVVVLGIVGRGMGRSRRVAALTFLLLGSLAAVVATPEGESPVPWGVLGGSAAVLFLWIGRALPRLRPARESRPSSLTRIRPLGSRAMVLVAAGLASVAATARAQRDDGGAFLALFPYEGRPDPTRPPDRVVLRLEDYERLTALAEGGARRRPPASPPRPRCIASPGKASMTSSWRPSGTWCATTPPSAPRRGGSRSRGRATSRRSSTATRCPSGSSRAARRRPSRSPARGRTDSASAGSPRPDAPRRARRSACRSSPWPRRAPSRTTAPTGGGPSCPARGRVEPRAAGVEAGLGPADRLDVRWVAAGEDQAPAPSGAVDGLILWDAGPAGDRVRARLTYRNPAGTSAIRIGLGPGVVVRPVAVPGLMDAVVQGPADRPEWLASVDPPLPDGTTIALEFWRPLTPSGLPDDHPSRSLPRVEPLGVERFGALLALRRPGDWSGRLTAAAGAGAEPMTEETFVKAWGALPDDPLTLSGAVRLAHATAVALEAGPPADRLVVQPAVQLVLAAGRVEVRMEADLVAASGRADRVAFDVPDALRIAWVDADGLTDWSRRAGRVLLRFDGPPARLRKLRLSGWVAIPSDPLAPGPAAQEVGVPWPRWVDADARPGTLTVSATAPFQLVDAGPGVVPLNPADGGRAVVGRDDAEDIPGGPARRPGPPPVGGRAASGRRPDPEPADGPSRLGRVGRGAPLRRRRGGRRRDPPAAADRVGRDGAGGGGRRGAHVRVRGAGRDDHLDDPARAPDLGVAAGGGPLVDRVPRVAAAGLPRAPSLGAQRRRRYLPGDRQRLGPRAGDRGVAGAATDRGPEPVPRRRLRRPGGRHHERLPRDGQPRLVADDPARRRPRPGGQPRAGAGRAGRPVVHGAARRLGAGRGAVRGRAARGPVPAGRAARRGRADLGDRRRLARDAAAVGLGALAGPPAGRGRGPGPPDLGGTRDRGAAGARRGRSRCRWPTTAGCRPW